jgi:protein O-GlcNAc transferase
MPKKRTTKKKKSTQSPFQKNQLPEGQAMEMAMQYHQMGDLQSAQAFYQQVLENDPNHSEALHLLGVIAAQIGNHQTAVELIQKAIKRNDTIPNFHNSLGNVLWSQGQLTEAENCYQRSLALNPYFTEAHNGLGNVLKEQGKWVEAAESYQRALRSNPNYAEAYYNLGNVRQAQGLLPEAIQCYQQALALSPNHIEAHYNLGISLMKQGNPAEAIVQFKEALALAPDEIEIHNHLGIALLGQGKASEAVQRFQRAIILKPEHSTTHYNLATALNKLGKFTEAIASYEKALHFNPDDASTHYNLAIALEQQGQITTAIDHYQQTIRLNPNHLEAHNNLGILFSEQGKFTEALACYQQALSLNPNYAEVHNHLAGVLLNQGELEQSLNHYRQALAIKPDFTTAHTALLLALHYVEGLEARKLFSEHQRFNEQHAKALKPSVARHLNDNSPHRKLKVGYVSPDFRQHPVAHFIEPVLRHHNRAEFEIFCYYTHAKIDAITQRLQQSVDHWINCVPLSDEVLAERIKQDQIDILIDLAGHTSDNRLLVFARKAAPVQVTYLGYPNTTGLTSIDYRITDHHRDPEGLADELSSETLIRMPESYYCYHPYENSPTIKNLPSLQNDFITFGSLNNYVKLNSKMRALWAEILQAVPDSKLRLKPSNQILNDPKSREAIEKQFMTLGIQPTQLIFEEMSPSPSHLNSYHQIDIALDSYPFNGGTTTCEALWMGVPVITLVGETHTARMGLSLLSTLGLSELIAYTPKEYVELAIKLANEKAYLQSLRKSLREKMQTSPLMDGPRYTHHLESAYRKMWEKWCASSYSISRLG